MARQKHRQGTPGLINQQPAQNSLLQVALPNPKRGYTTIKAVDVSPRKHNPFLVFVQNYIYEAGVICKILVNSSTKVLQLDDKVVLVGRNFHKASR